jgi:light-regulated signal transduction histidine kinase (bacteriophytochrome)
VDLTHCEKEPIHIPGSIQSHGILLALHEPDLLISQVSANVAEVLGIPPAQLLGSPLQQLLGPPSLGHVAEALRSDRPQENNPLPLVVGSRRFDGIVHRHQGATLLELEPERAGEEGAGPLARALQRAIARIQAAPSMRELCETAAREVRALTGFDRVVLYHFDEEENGEVLAEDKLEGLEPFLGLHYPASDIPRQARQLYILNWLRIIPDREYRPVPIVPALRPDNQQPLDLSFSVLRSVSPIHLEYLKNMGIRASMSISLVRGTRLWGLISCGHQSPRYISYEVRSACELIGRITAQQIAASEEKEALEARKKQRVLQARLVEGMREETGNVLSGLLRHPVELLELVGASGVVISSEEERWTAGAVPSPEIVEALIGWLREQAPGEVFSTKALPRLLPAVEPAKGVASGLLAISIPKPVPDYVLWFRPEVIQSVNWGGNPAKPVEVEGPEQRLHPRRSFELWKEVVRSTSLQWSASELEAAASLRRYAIEVELGLQVVRKQQAVDARDDLVAVVSHDLKNPLAAIQLQTGLILRAVTAEEGTPWRRVQTSAEQIQRSAERMRTLIQDLLDLAKIEAGRFTVSIRAETIEDLMGECLEILSPLAGQKHIRLTHQVSAPNAMVSADRERIFQVLSNLLGNAIKFTPEQGAIHLAVDSEGDMIRFAVRDTGPGIAREQLSQVFNRYWQARKQASKGTGLGLYIVKGIIEAHGGKVWADSEEGRGSTFYFTLPVAKAHQEVT